MLLGVAQTRPSRSLAVKQRIICMNPRSSFSVKPAMGVSHPMPALCPSAVAQVLPAALSIAMESSIAHALLASSVAVKQVMAVLPALLSQEMQAETQPGVAVQ